MSTPAKDKENLLRRPQVQQRTGLSRSTIYDHIAKGNFPAPISLGDRAVAWLESEIDSWIAHRINVCRKNIGQDS